MMVIVLSWHSSGPCKDCFTTRIFYITWTFLFIPASCGSTQLYRLFSTPCDWCVLDHWYLDHLGIKIRAYLILGDFYLAHLPGPVLALIAGDIPTAGLRAGCLSLTCTGSNIILHLVFLLLGPAFRLVDCLAYLRTRGVAISNKRIPANLNSPKYEFEKLCCWNLPSLFPGVPSVHTQ